MLSRRQDPHSSSKRHNGILKCRGARSLAERRDPLEHLCFLIARFSYPSLDSSLPTD